MKLQKQLTAALAGAALFGSVANAEIPLTDELSAYGYIDLALTDGEGDANTETAVAEFELGLAFTPAESKWSAVAELSYDSNSDSDSNSTTTRGDGADGVANTADDTFTTTTTTTTNSSAEFETVTITYAYSDELSFTAGNILSYQGFEAFDATGLYQFSAQGIGGGYVYSADYAVGASADYTSGDYAFGAWVGDTDDAKQSYEFLAAFTGVEGLTVKAIYADDPGYETVNVWASYDIGALTFAVEYTSNDWEDDFTAGEERPEDIHMALVYYSLGDAGITFRYSGGDYENDIEFDRYTFSPSYSFSDNVFGLLEVSYEEVGDEDSTTLAAELIYSF